MDAPLIKNKFSLVIAGILTIPLLYFIADRIQLLHVGVHVDGVVEEVTAHNDRCSRRSGKHTTYYDCTKYNAIIGFNTLPPPIHSTFELSWWSESWHNQPVTYSSRQKWDLTKVIYDPKKISRVYEDTLWGIWWVPIMNLVMQLSFFGWAFSEEKKKY